MQASYWIVFVVVLIALFQVNEYELNELVIFDLTIAAGVISVLIAMAIGILPVH